MPRTSRSSVVHCASQGALLVWLTTCVACAHPPSDTSADDAPLDPPLDASFPSEQAAASDAAAARLPALAACAALGGSSPQRVADVIARINELPEPASIPCLIASLPRPFSVVATNSVFSAQPATDAKSPRIFIMLEGLTLSVVPAGRAQDLLEFGEWITERSTLKGELEFPVTRPVAADAPFVRVDQGQSISVCGFCHAHETAHPTIARAFVSDALRVAPSTEVSLAAVRGTREACDQPAGEGPHCTLLHALFDYGEVRQGAFDRSLMTFF